ncbi:MAG: hypothetical protein AAF934_00355 [Bacteroidota bacterium]
MTKKTWTPKEETYLSEQPKPLNIKAIASHLKRSQKSVLEKAQRMGLTLWIRPFAGFEVAYIKQYYTQKTDLELGQDLGRSEETIAEKMAELGLKRTVKIQDKLQRNGRGALNAIETVATEVSPQTEDKP